MGADETPRRPKRSARARIMDLLARRNHSAHELRERLADDYPSEEIEAAIQLARESRWLLPDDEIAEGVARSLDRRKKGHRFISQYLKGKGLPSLPIDVENEINKAVELIQQRLQRPARINGRPFDRDQARRFLANRGFDDATIRKALDLTGVPAPRPLTRNGKSANLKKRGFSRRSFEAPEDECDPES